MKWTGPGDRKLVRTSFMFKGGRGRRRSIQHVHIEGTHLLGGWPCLFPGLLLVLSSWSCSLCPWQHTRMEIGVRNAHAMAYDGARERVVLFGGADAFAVRGDTWEWDGHGWARVSLEGPSARTFASMAYDSLRGRLVLFGGNRVLFGTDDGDTFLDDTWEWDGRRWTQVKLPGPAARAEAAIAFDSKRGCIVMFGGYSRTKDVITRFGDTWEWNGAHWTQLAVTGPSPTNGATMAYDPVLERTVLFGGRVPHSGETWTWDGRQWMRRASTDVEGRYNTVMAYDVARRVTIRFGGYHEGERFGDTWAYDGNGWDFLSSTGPTPRNHTAMAYDLRRQTMVLFGGHDGTMVFGDTWEWDGREWSQRVAIEPQTRLDNGH